MALDSRDLSQIRAYLDSIIEILAETHRGGTCNYDRREAY